jgi:hypothetical protein
MKEGCFEEKSSDISDYYGEHKIVSIICPVIASGSEAISSQ